MAKKANKKEYALDLRKVLSAIDTGKFSFYKSLNDKEKKEVNFYTLMRYMSSAKDNDFHELFVIAINEYVNKNYTTLQKNHPELLWKLLCLVSTGSAQFHPWIPPIKKKKNDKTKNIDNFIRNKFPNMKDDDIKLFLQINNNEDIIKEAEDIGLSKDEVNEIRKELLSL